MIERLAGLFDGGGVRDEVSDGGATPCEPEADIVATPPAAWRAIYKLLRPSDSGIALAATLIGARLAGRPILDADTLLMTLANGLLVAGSAAANDWHDVVEDRVNKPHSPVASGRVRRRTALTLGCILLAAAVLAASLVDGRLGLVACFFVASSLAYTLRLKGLPFLGNALVAVLSSEALWCWLVLEWPANFSPYPLLCACCIAFCLGRELFGTARDLEGDRRRGVTTAASLLGGAGANRLGLALIAVAGVAAWTPVLLGQTRFAYPLLLVASFGLLGRLAWSILLTPGEQAGSRSARLVMIARWITVLMALAAGFGVAVA